jgi:SAM-dependent methyltransferase
MTHDTPNTTATQVRAGTSSRLALWITLAIVTAAAAFGIRYFSSHAFFVDPAPVQRTPRNAPFITSPDAVVNKMVEMARISDGDLVYDLGCGDGRIVITAAVQRGCRGVGFDLDPKRVAESIENARLHGVDHLVTIKEQDLFEVDLREAQVIMMYLLPWMIEKLTPKLEQCAPGTRIVSHDFRIEGIENQEVTVVPLEDKPHYVYAYVTPLTRSSKQPKYRNWKDAEK